jgi:hypothetical protein
VEVRSYRRVFDLERRIYRIERLRLNPTGVPVRGIVYFLTLLGFVVVAVRLPLLGLLAARLPWYARYVLAPGLLATLLAVIRIDGRSFHLAARAMLRHRLGPSRLVRLAPANDPTGAPVGSRWTPAPVLLLPDGSEGTTRRLRYRGPGAVRLGGHHRWEAASGARARFARGPHVIVRASPARPKHGEVIVLERDARLEVR